MTTSPTATDGEARPRLQVLSPAAIRRIHTATLDVIERVGVRFPSARAQAIWAAHGATVDRESGIVRVPGHVIEAALKHGAARPTRWAPGTRRRTCRSTAARPPGHGRLRHRGAGPVDAGGAPVVARGRGGHRARRRRPGRDRVPLGGRVRTGPSARRPGRSRRSPRSSATPPSTPRPRASSPPRRRRTAVEMAAAIAGGRDALRARPDVLDDAVHDQPARPRRRVHRRGAGGGGGRRSRSAS